MLEVEETHEFLNEKAFLYERHPVEDMEPIEPGDVSEMAQRFTVLLHWLARGVDQQGRFMPQGIGLRAGVMLAALNPRLVGHLTPEGLALALQVPEKALRLHLKAASREAWGRRLRRRGRKAQVPGLN